MLRRTAGFVLAISAVVIIGCARPVEISTGRGRDLYLAYGCAACHGANGDGKGPGSALSSVPPRDLRDLYSYASGSTEQDIARAIEVGMKASGMPAYTELPLDERLSIARWIRSIAKETK